MQKENMEEAPAPRLIGRKGFAVSALAVGAGALLGTPSRALASGSIPAYLDSVETFTADQLFTGKVMFKGGAPWFDVTAFGALGNGVADDSAAIQAAINAAAAVSVLTGTPPISEIVGGTVFFPPGIYAVGAALNLKTLVRLAGSGANSTIIRTTSPTLDIISATGTSATPVGSIEICDLQIDSAITRTSGSALSFFDVSQYQIENVRFVDTFNIFTMNGDYAGNGGGRIRDVTIGTNGGVIKAGFYFASCTDTQINGVCIEAGRTALATTAAWFQFDSLNNTVQIDNVSISYNTAGYGGGVALYLSDNTHPGSPSQWVRVSNFRFSGGPSDGSSPIQNVIVIDNALSAYFFNGYVGDGVTGITLKNGKDFRFANLLLGNMDKHGIMTWAAVADVTFDGCTISNVGIAPPLNTYYGIYVAANVRATISNCNFGNEIWGSSPVMQYAICNASNQTVVLNCSFASGSYHLAAISAATLVPQGYYGAGPVPALTGSRSGNAALQSLLQDLAGLGMIVNNTTS